jgi:hypothetical protein
MVVAGGNPLVNMVGLSGLNHLFQACQNGIPTEYNRIEETFSPAALKLISDRVREITSCQSP